jgi:hypothetical protein
MAEHDDGHRLPSNAEDKNACNLPFASWRARGQFHFYVNVWGDRWNGKSKSAMSNVRIRITKVQVEIETVCEGSVNWPETVHDIKIGLAEQLLVFEEDSAQQICAYITSWDKVMLSRHLGPIRTKERRKPKEHVSIISRSCLQSQRSPVCFAVRSFSSDQLLNKTLRTQWLKR